MVVLLKSTAGARSHTSTQSCCILQYLGLRPDLLAANALGARPPLASLATSDSDTSTKCSPHQHHRTSPTRSFPLFRTRPPRRAYSFLLRSNCSRQLSTPCNSPRKRRPHGLAALSDRAHVPVAPTGGGAACKGLRFHRQSLGTPQFDRRQNADAPWLTNTAFFLRPSAQFSLVSLPILPHFSAPPLCHRSITLRAHRAQVDAFVEGRYAGCASLTGTYSRSPTPVSPMCLCVASIWRCSLFFDPPSLFQPAMCRSTCHNSLFNITRQHISNHIAIIALLFPYCIPFLPPSILLVNRSDLPPLHLLH